MVLRVSPDGTFAKILLQNWPSTTNCLPYTDPGGTVEQHCLTSGSYPTVSNDSAITNGGTGVAVFSTTVNTVCGEYYDFGVGPTSQTSCPDFEAHTELTYVSKDAPAGQVKDAVVFPNDSGRLEAFFPVLQREDGSYIGTDSTVPFGYSNVAALGPSGGILWKEQANSNYLSPLYATADGGEIVTSSKPAACPSGNIVIDPFDQSKKCQSTSPYPYSPQGQLGTLYTLDQYGTVTSQTPDTGALVSWSGYSYADPAGTLSELSLPLVDVDPNNFGASFGGNSSHTGAAFPPCPCIISLAWVFGAAPNIPTAVPKPTQDVVKVYPEDIACVKTPLQLITAMETDFSGFADFTGYSSYKHIPWAVKATVHFTGTVSLGATIGISNTDVDSLLGGFIKTMTFNVAVEVTQVTPTSFTFTTLPGHVLYPATIKFAASSNQAGTLHFTIDVNGKFANEAAKDGYKDAGSDIEDHIWNHVLAQVAVSCSP